MNQYPKILIFGQPFNKYSGGGITLSNLFRGWPKDRIAVAAIGHLNQYVATDVCDTYYQLGKEEHRWRFPFNLIQKPFPSGLLSFEGQKSTGPVVFRTSLRNIFVDKIFYPFIHWIGIFHCMTEISMSDRFRAWLKEYKPDVLYIQVTTREAVLFSIRLHEYLKIPAVIHNMDDWPSTISRNGLLKNYWRKKIDREFRQLLDRVDLYLSISHAMSAEYKKRYNKDFIAFHNPIDISKFRNNGEKKEINDDVFRILYIGRIGIANKDSISAFARTVSEWNNDNKPVEFRIYTTDLETRDTKLLSNLKNVKIFPAVSHDEVHHLLHMNDLLLLPLDFTKSGFRYAQFSLPTKASEYMISGTPILVFAPGETAISKFCQENECAYCLTELNEEQIRKTVDFLINNEDYRNKISRKAVALASELFDSEKVQREFQQLIINTSKSKDYV